MNGENDMERRAEHGGRPTNSKQTKFSTSILEKAVDILIYECLHYSSQCMNFTLEWKAQAEAEQK